MPPKRMGRPQAENPKSELLRVRVDSSTLKKLDECKEMLNTTRSDVIRKGIEKIHDDLKK